MSGTKDNLNFNNFSGYYNSLYHSSYGGFDWFNMLEMNKQMLNVLGYCDTGYNNALHGRGEGVAIDTNSFMYTYANTFNLKSGIFASAWDSSQPVTIYAWANGAETGSITVNLSQNATKINFAKYGSEFQNINLIEIKDAKGTGGNTCTYGKATYGYQIAFDNLKITMNTGGAHAHGSHFVPEAIARLEHQVHHGAHVFAAHLTTVGTGGHPDGSPPTHRTDGHASGGYHSMLTSLDGALHHDPSGNLTSQFQLPQLEHFGT